MSNPTAQLYSTEEGKVVDWELTVDKNAEIVATHNDEMLKFPAGLTKKQLTSLFDKHNKAHEGIVARDPEEVAAEEKRLADSQELIDSL